MQCAASNRLGLHRLREALLHYPGDATVQLLPLRLEQSFVSSVPHQRVLEGVAASGRVAGKDQLGRGEPVQGGLYLGIGERRDRREERVGELAPDASRHLRHLLDPGRPVRRAMSESWSVVGIASCGSGPASS